MAITLMHLIMGVMAMVIRLLGYMEVMAIEAGTVTMADIEVVMAVAIMAAGMAAFAVVVDKIQIVRDRQFNRNFGDFAFVEWRWYCKNSYSCGP
jgi:hypothetical protein